MSELKNELKDMLKTQCGVISEISDDAILFGVGEQFGLDSIDYLQICMYLCVTYGIEIKLAEYRVTFLTVLKDINTMADYVSKHRGEI